MDLAELVARESIRDAIARYNANGDAGRIDAVVDVFAPDCVFELVDGEHRSVHHGHDGVRAVMSSFAERWRADAEATGTTPYVRHLVTTTQIDVVDATTATARSYVVALMAHGVDHWGRYVDRFALVGGRWLLAHRVAITERRLFTDTPHTA